MICASVREKVNNRHFQISTVSHATHGWFVVHDVRKPWHSVTKIERHVSQHVAKQSVLVISQLVSDEHNPYPGETLFTRIPIPASSTPSAFARATTAPLLEQ